MILRAWAFICLLLLCENVAHAQVPTKIIIFKPYTQENTLATDIVVAQRYIGTCLTHSIATPGRLDAWRCNASNVVLDPCFEDHDSLACINTPWTHKVALIELKSPLYKTTQANKKLTTLHPWAVELANGQRCTFLTGASSVIQKMRVNYTCNSYKYNILGDINRTSTTWKAWVYDYDYQKLQLIDVVVAYY